MQAEVIGIDHIYVSVRAMEVSERFYDQVLIEVLGFRKSKFTLGANNDPHVQYYNRQGGWVIRPAREGTPDHDSRAPGLHHFCWRVEDEAAVDRVATALKAAGIAASEPRYYPEYDSDYYATFFEDPDGLRLEVTNLRASRRARMERWDNG